MQNSYKSVVVGFIGGIIATSLILKLFNKFKRNKQNITASQITQIDCLNDEEYTLLKKEQLARVIKFFGEPGFKKLQNSFVIVFGVGGVGSHVVNMLVRSGVRRIRVVDFDRVSLSSLNRHSFAVREDVGTAKVLCIKKYAERIFKHVRIQTVEAYVTVENAQQLVDTTADYVVDCIDNLEAKVELIATCVSKGVRLIVSGGAGMKNDPTKLQIRDIADCKYDKLILRIKRQLTKKGIKSGVKVAFSYQQAEKQLLPLTSDQQEKPQAFKVFDNYRIRIVPVLGTMPAIIGMAIASYVLCELAGEPYAPFETDYVKSTAINKLYNELTYDEKRRGVSAKELSIDIEEVSIITKKIFRWQCGLTGKKESNLRLCRWDPSKPAQIDNLILLSKQAYEKHAKLNSLQQAQYSVEITQIIQHKLQQARKLMESGYMMFI